MIDKIAPGLVGADVGGTPWLCERLTEKGCDITHYDWLKPETYPKYIQGDMMEVIDHFPEGSLDFICTRHTLEHSLTPLFQLWSYNRILKDKGRLYVIVPCHIREWIWYPTHHSPLPLENWIMLFYRAGFKTITSDAGTWNKSDSKYIEHRFELQVETRKMRMNYTPQTFAAM